MKLFLPKFVCTGIFIAVIFLQNCFAQKAEKQYLHLLLPVQKQLVFKTNESIKIDGKDTEQAWQNTSAIQKFVDIEGDIKPAPKYSTRVKMLFDDNNLYIFAQLEEPHIWAYYNIHDQIVYHENDFEVFIDPDRDAHNYFEFEINAQNNLFDLFLNKPYRDGGRPDIKWNAEGFKSAVYIEGTINNGNDVDKYWCVEMAIPFSSLTTNGKTTAPANGDFWKINFSRVEWQTVYKKGKYEKLKDRKTNRFLPENNWVWSPQGVINMHFPERWGILQFCYSKNQKPLVQPNEMFVQKLWLLYYKQKDYKKINGKYARFLSDLGISQTGKINNKKFTIELTGNNEYYTAKLNVQNGAQIRITHDGKLTSTLN